MNARPIVTARPPKCLVQLRTVCSRVANLSSPKKPDLVPKKARKSQIAVLRH